MRVALLVFAAFLMSAVIPPGSASHAACPPEDCPTLVPPQVLPILQGHLNLERFELGVDVVDGLSVTRMALHLDNNATTDAELDVTVPLTGPLMALNLTLDDRVLEGRVEEVASAVRQYNEAKEQGRSAVLLRQAEPDVVRLQVNVPASEKAILRLAYGEVVPRASGAWVYRFPLGVLGLVPAASTIDVALQDTHGVKDLGFPTLPLDGAGPWHREGLLPDATDLVMTWRNDGEAMTSRLVLGQAAGEEGVALATLCTDGLDVMTRDVVFVLDTSGSMSGTKIQAAREALADELALLLPGDRYDVVAFDDHVETYESSLVAPTASNVQKHQARVRGELADRGTDIDGGLQRALDVLRDGKGAMAMVVFLTDGLPSAGVQDHDLIIERFRTANTRHAVVEVVPIGLDADRTFLADLALRSGGLYLPVGANDPSMTDRVGRILDLVGQVQMADVTVSSPGLTVTMDAAGVTYEDACLTVGVSGTFPATGDIMLDVQGKSAGGDVTKRFTFDAAQLSVHEAVPSLWGQRHVAHLLSQERVEDVDLRADIVAAAIELRQLSPYTAWIVVDTKDEPTPEPAEGEVGHDLSAAGSPSGAASGAMYSVNYSNPSASPASPTSPVSPGSPQASTGTSGAGEASKTPGPGLWAVLGVLAALALGLRRRGLNAP